MNDDTAAKTGTTVVFEIVPALEGVTAVVADQRRLLGFGVPLSAVDFLLFPSAEPVQSQVTFGCT